MHGAPVVGDVDAARDPDPVMRLHMVESLSGHLSAMLNARQLDLAVLFDTDPARRWSVTPLLEEKLFLIRSRQGLAVPGPDRTRMARLQGVPLILPTGPHGLRSTLNAAFERARITLVPAGEIDSLAMLMEAVEGEVKLVLMSRLAAALAGLGVGAVAEV